MEDNKRKSNFKGSAPRKSYSSKGSSSFSGGSRASSRNSEGFKGERKPRFGDDKKPRFNDNKKHGFGGDGKSRFSDDKKQGFGSQRKAHFGDKAKSSFRDGNKKPEFNKNSRLARTYSKSSENAKTFTKQDAGVIKLDNRIEIALQALIDVEKNGKYINLAFKNNEKLDRLEKKDRAYVMRILYGVTEKNYTLNWLLSQVLKDKRIKPWLNAILKIGTYQIFFMRIEDSEAIEQARLLCNKYVSDELCGFVTAVLSKLSENKNEYDPETYVFASTTQRLSVMYSYPEWLIEMWMRDYGQETAMALIESDTADRAINIRVSARESCDAVIEQLTEDKIRCERGMLLNTVTISDTVNIETLPLYQEGKLTAQGIGSMLTVNALDVKSDSAVLDACAAPGGKTFYIAEKTKNTVESCDIHEHRVELIQKGVERLGLANVNPVCRDMTQRVEEYVNAFDRVLIDAPCSGFGMINSKPDIKNNALESEIDDLATIQQTILSTSAEYVKAGGVLVYSTCTVSKRENEDNVRKFLAEHPEFELIDLDRVIPDVLNYSVEDGMILLLPSRHNADAFFISAMRRK